MTQIRPRATTTGTRRSSAAATGCSHAAGCDCPVCAGLQTFVRPRFFAGQLLTDSELTALTSYVVDKQRLHNVHLHGWGVVCGLQVECDGCGPGVLVRPGYAIDPCGYDIVAPGATSVDVLGLIQQCQSAQSRLDCDPPRVPSAAGCADEQTWCLYVRYQEQQTRPVVPLGGTAGSSRGCGCGGSSSAGSAAGGCGCGGGQPLTGRKGWECTCGGGGSRSTTTCGCATSTAAAMPADCQPSRTYESYQFGVCRSESSCGDLGDRLLGTFPMKVWECIKHIQPVVSKGMTKQMQHSSATMLLGGKAVTGTTPSDAVCQLYRNVLELYRNDPMRTQCVLPEQLSDIDCSPQAQEESDAHYQQRLVAALQALVVLVLLYLRDCICYSMLPPCPEGACDDRVVLACLTVKDGVVTSVCNFDCRRYAGSFVSRDYWLPIGPVLSWLAGLVCCFPLVDLRPRFGWGGRTRLAAFATGSRFDALRTAIRRDDFALPKMWRIRAFDLAGRLHPATLADQVERAAEATTGAIALARYVGQPAEVVSAALDRQGLKIETTQVDQAWRAPLGRLIPAVRAGGAVQLFVHDGRVVAVTASTGPARTARRGTRRSPKADT